MTSSNQEDRTEIKQIKMITVGAKEGRSKTNRLRLGLAGIALSIEISSVSPLLLFLITITCPSSIFQSITEFSEKSHHDEEDDQEYSDTPANSSCQYSHHFGRITSTTHYIRCALQRCLAHVILCVQTRGGALFCGTPLTSRAVGAASTIRV